jgi:maleate isomerase
MHRFRAMTVRCRRSCWYFVDVAFTGRLVWPLRPGSAGIGRWVARREAVLQSLVALIFRHEVSFRFLKRFIATRVHWAISVCETVAMTSPVRLGMLTPSSNTVLEQVVAAMVSSLGISAHFSRFRVTEIALTGDALAQFDDSPILAAAELLAHAKVDVIAWNGTSSGWLGFDADHRLCARIEAATGIRATTSMLALNEVLATTGVKRFGLVTPYIDAVQQRIVTNYADLGVVCDAERHLGIQDNFAFAEVPPATLKKLIQDVAAKQPDAIGVICTNLRAAPLVAELEAEIGIPIYDTIATAVWKSLKVAGVDPARVVGWGRIFAL